MLSAHLATLLFLGILPSASSATVRHAPPGIEHVAIVEPSPLEEIPPPALSASGAILIDRSTGHTLFAVDADTPRPMASLTKLMTALIITERHQPDDIVTIPSIVTEIPGSTIGLTPGEHMSVRDLLRSMLIPSANDAAYALASFDGPGLPEFMKRMNQRGKELGLKATHMANPAGLDHPEQYASARDLALLTMAVLRHRILRTIVDTRTMTVATIEGKAFGLRNTNEMLHYNESVHGVKTGTTNGAGECLILLIEQKNREYILVLMGSKDRYTDGLRVLTALKEALH